MKNIFVIACALLSPNLFAQENVPPVWAYAMNPPGSFGLPADNTPRHVPGSRVIYNFAQLKDLFFTPDWHPQDHLPMPEIVAQGRKPDTYACGFCHRADGPGGPENASLAGLPRSYILEQIADFKNGTRTSAIPTRAPINGMVLTAKAVTSADLLEAADYFSSLKPRANIKVVETKLAPKTFERGWHLAKSEGNETELLEKRIIEVPDDLNNFINRDSHASFTAYVPKGSIAQGKKLSQKKIENYSCTQCHGKSLRGEGDIPRLAGRSPSYLVRQLYDFKTGARKGSNSQFMRTITNGLNMDDMIALAAYSASLSP